MIQIINTDLKDELRNAITLLSEPSDWADSAAYQIHCKDEPDNFNVSESKYKIRISEDLDNELYNTFYNDTIDIPHEEIKPLQIESKDEK